MTVFQERFDLGNIFVVVKVRIADLKEQDVNAHFMPSATFNRLSENVAERGGLQSFPLVARPGGEGPVEILSGHHRIRAARAAGETEVWCLLDEALETRSAIVSAQLAHNALVGNDDPGLVKALLKRIDNPDDLLRSGLSDELPKIETAPFGMFVPNLDFRWKTLSFVFLPHQMAEFEDLIDDLDGRQDLVGAVPEELFERFLTAASGYAKVKGVKSVGTMIALMCRAAEREIREHELDGASE